MSTRKYEICTCDICGKEGAKNYSVLAYRTFDGNDGKCFYDHPQFEYGNLDMCEECAIRSTSVHSIGVCNEKYEIKKYFGDEQPTADVVEVVRCKDCEHFIFVSDYDGDFCLYLNEPVDDMDYCSRSAKRKVQNENTNVHC